MCPVAMLLLAGCGATIDESVGGTVTGLSGGTTVTLVNNGTDALSVPVNGTFTFNTKISAGSSYNVAVQANPTGEICTVENGTGTISSTTGAVTNVAVKCVANLANYYQVTVSVAGLATGATVTLLEDAADSMTVSANGTFSFPTQLLIGTAYNVTVSANPKGQTCTVTNPTGTAPTSGTATPVSVKCS